MGGRNPSVAIPRRQGYWVTPVAPRVPSEWIPASCQTFEKKTQWGLGSPTRSSSGPRPARLLCFGTAAGPSVVVLRKVDTYATCAITSLYISRTYDDGLLMLESTVPWRQLLVRCQSVSRLSRLIVRVYIYIYTQKFELELGLRVSRHSVYIHNRTSYCYSML